MTTPAKLSTIPAGYVPGTSGGFTTIPALFQFLKGELQKIAISTSKTSLMTPQPAIKAPTEIADGMIRLSRSPWRPLSGQTVDTWVYYDAPSGSWKAL